MILKIRNINLNIFNKDILNSKNSKAKQGLAALPIVASPIVAYKVSPHGQNKRNENIVKEAANKAVNNSATDPITDRTKLNEQALKKAGVKESDISKHIDSKGYMDNDGKEICKKAHVTSFKGEPRENIEQFGGTIEHNNSNDMMEDLYSSAPIQYDDVAFNSDLEISDIGSMLGDEISTEAETIAQTIADLPLLESVYGLSLLLKAKDPLIDLKNGNFKAAGIRTGVRVVDTFLLPIKYARALGGGLKGTWLSIKGIESDHTGFINGYKKGLTKWVKGRRIIEEYAINPDKFEMPSSADRYAEYRQWQQEKIAEWQEAIKDKSNKMGERFNSWCENNMKYHESMSKNFSEIFMNENQRTDFYKIQFKNIVEDKEINTSLIQQDLESLQQEQENLKNLYNQYIDSLKISLEKIKDDKQSLQKLKAKSKEVEQYYKIRQEKLTHEINKINNMLFINNKIQQRKDSFGFAKVAGYDDIKQYLQKILVKEVENFNVGKTYQLPNMILLYGPKGCGKSLIADALEEETGCNVINLNLSLDPLTDRKNFYGAINKAEESFKENGTYTIIRIDEIDEFLYNMTLTTDFKKILNNLSKEKHCTIVATTNYPQKINKDLVLSCSGTNIYIPPANKKNIQQVLKYYMKDFVDTSIDYDELTEHILDIAYDEAYSNAQIASYIQRGISTRFIQKGKLTQQDFIEILNESEPDIAKEILDFYNRKGR